MMIAIGSDHAGYELKEKIKTFLNNQKIACEDMGTYSLERADYPDFGHKVAEAVLNKSVNFGIVICGSGNGINMAANKHKGIRSALCWTPEIATLARLHNNANVLALPARFISDKDAEECVKAFLNTSFEGGRHEDRVIKIDC